MIDKTSTVLTIPSVCDYCKETIPTTTKVIRIRFSHNANSERWPQDHFTLDYHEAHWDPKPQDDNKTISDTNDTKKEPDAKA